MITDPHVGINTQIGQHKTKPTDMGSSIIYSVAIFLLCTIRFGSAAASTGLTTETFNNSLTLDNEGNYQLFWKYNTTHVTFEVHVKTHGYVGFGLSPNGDMFPGDVVVGWIKDGTVFFKDYHTTAHAAPVLDKHQDWFLIHGEENELGTILKFARKIDTCDQEDMVISKATQRVIYSYHPEDPANEQSLSYHGGDRRGTKSVSLLNVNTPPIPLSDEDIKVFDFTARNYIVPDTDTTYMCIGFQMPDLGGKHHMIGFEPIFTPGNERLVHHLVIQRCPGLHPHLDGVKGDCFKGMPKGWPMCPEIFIGWATGGGPFYFPSHTGYPVGGAADFSFYVMQLHYDNPSLKAGIMDNSGIRMRLTSKLRQHDVGALVVGHSVSPYQVIPPHQPAFVSKGFCSEKCVSKVMDVKGVSVVKVVSLLQHAHLLATGIKTRHFRNGTEIAPLYDDPNYDFYFQEVRSLPEEVTIKKGDSFRVECTYTTTSLSEPTFGGLTTREEMCETFVYHYPKLDLVACSSLPNMDKLYNQNFKPSQGVAPGNVSLVDFMKTQIDWNNATDVSQYISDVDSASIAHTCVHQTDNVNQPFGSEVWEYQERESDFIPYVAPQSTCDTQP